MHYLENNIPHSSSTYPPFFVRYNNTGVVTPILKECYLDPAIITHVSYISLMMKTCWREFSCQIQLHQVSNKPFQSGFHPRYSTETVPHRLLMTSSFLLSQSSQFEPSTMNGFACDTVCNNILKHLASLTQFTSGSRLTLMKVVVVFFSSQ